MFAATIQNLNYSGQECKKQLSVQDSDTPVTLKEGQGHQTRYELVDHKQGSYHAKFSGPPLKNIYEKANVKGTNFPPSESETTSSVHGMS